MRLIPGLFLILLAGAAIAWVMRDALLSAMTPGGGASVTRSIAFSAGERGTLDVYVPAHARNAPVAVFFYGGAWEMGRKELYGFVGKALAARGVLTVIPDYRLYPEIRYPGFLEDGAKAVHWAKDNAARFGGDPNRLFVAGHSAGAYNAAMLALDKTWLAAEGLDPGRDLAGLVGLSGPYDFLPLQSDTLIAIFGGADRPETQPITSASASAPPALLVTGDADTIVLPRNATSLADRLTGLGVPVKEQILPGKGHFTTVLAFLGPLQWFSAVADEVAGFMHAATPGKAQS